MTASGPHLNAVPHARTRIPFRAVNRRGSPGYDPGLQRHHLLPRQLLALGCFRRLFERLDRDAVGFGDFRRNGLLLPAAESAALRTALPLHRGPHRTYNDLIIERVGQIEHDWSGLRLRAPDLAASQAIMRLGLLQRAIRRRLLRGRPRFLLNRKDPLGSGCDFSELDAMADKLWRGTQPAEMPAFSASSTRA